MVPGINLVGYSLPASSLEAVERRQPVNRWLAAGDALRSQGCSPSRQKEEGDTYKQDPLVGDRGRKLSDRVVDDMWDPVNSFLKSHNYLTKRLSAFSQPTARSSFSTAQSPQQFFQKP